MKKISVLALCLMASVGLFAQVQVTADKSGTELQAAIDAAEAGTTVYVQAGTYIGNFTMKEGVNVSGGWNESFTAQTDYATILDANASGRVLHQAAAFSTLTVWSNLTIQNGKFTAQQTDKAGSGVFLCDKGQVKHCLIQNNLFDAASGEASGGGVYENGFTESVLVDDCIIRGNTASHAGGVRICGVMQNSIIENNTTSINACGGVQLHYGGAMYNCIVRNNSGKDCGGVRLTGTKACTVANCLIAGNTAKGSVGGMSLESGIHYVYNNTIVGNNQSSSNPTRCGVRLNVGAALEFANNIVWGNKANDVVQESQLEINTNYLSGQAAHFNNNAIAYASEFGTNTITLSDTDPGFTNAASADYTLLETSSLVNAGNNAYAQGIEDLAGNPRISGTTVDIGCYEYQYPVIVDNYVHSDEDLQEAINATPAGETVYVQSGTYYGNFTMKEGVNVSGGWNEDFTSQTDYATILDAQESGRVVNQVSNFSNLTVWENLTIQHGKLTENLDTYGAGVFLRKNGQVKHCIIQDNTFTYSGNCVGGGVGNNEVNEHSDVLIDDCIIRRNLATHGGGVRIVGTIQNSVIEDNSTTNNAGGGVHLFNGGCMYNCIVRNNTGKDTGGVRMSGSPAGTMANCLIVGNNANGTIGGVSLESGIHYVYNNTIVGNNQSSSNPTRCGVRLNVGAALEFANNIVWGNKANDVVQESQLEINANYLSGQAAHFNNNAIAYASEFGTNTITLTDADPGFADAANGDYTLVGISSLVNSGDNTYAQGTEDLSGNARIAGGRVDIGCYELPHMMLTVAAFEHATLTVKGIGVLPAGTYSVPYGYTTTATIAVEEGYKLTSVKLGEEELIPVEGVYTIPALTEDTVVTIIVEEDEGTGLDQVSANVCRKVVRDGQVIIIRDGKDYNVLGF